MNNNIHNNLVNISNFNNMINMNNILFSPINNNNIGNNNIYRLIQEIKELNGHIYFGKVWGIYFKYWSLNNNPYEWVFSLRGLDSSPYSGGLFYIKGTFPPDYPQHPPIFCFITPFYHLNVNPKNYPDDPLGRIEMVKLNWWESKYISIKDFIIDIHSFFWCGGDPEGCYGLERADLFRNNIDLYNKRVRYFTKKYAEPSFPYKEYDSWDFSLPDELK